MTFTVLFTREERFKVEVEAGSESLVAGTASHSLKTTLQDTRFAQTGFSQEWIGPDLTVSEQVDWQAVGKLPRGARRAKFITGGPNHNAQGR